MEKSEHRGLQTPHDLFRQNLELVRYLAAGVINTLVGYGVFLALLVWAGVAPELANAGGYVTGLLMAFTLNYHFVFAHAVMSLATIWRFMAASLLAFLLNQAVLMVLCRYFLTSPKIAQIFAMIAYTVIFYLLNKWFVFSAGAHSSKFNQRTD